MTADPLSATFAALADPTRRAILSQLSRGQVSVKELAKPFDMSLPAISRHLKVLERARLIARSRNAQWRPCQLKAQPLKEAVDWLEHYRRFWEESLDRLDEYLQTLQKQQKEQTAASAASAAPKTTSSLRSPSAAARPQQPPGQSPSASRKAKSKLKG